MARSCHAAVCLWYGGDHSQLLVTGGWDKNFKVLSDTWILNLQAGRWREVRSVLIVQVEMTDDHTICTGAFDPFAGWFSMT